MLLSVSAPPSQERQRARGPRRMLDCAVSSSFLIRRKERVKNGAVTVEVATDTSASAFSEILMAHPRRAAKEVC